MKTLFCHIRRFLLGLGIVALAGLCACGAGGGSGAAPSGDGGGVVAIEIPAVNDVGDIMYITGPVVAGGSSSLSAKSVGGMSTSKVAMNGTYGAHSSLNACITANVVRDVFKSGAMPDMMVCLLQNHIAPGMEQQKKDELEALGIGEEDIKDEDISVTDGQDHDGAIWVQKSNGVEQAKFRFNISKNSAGNITDFTIYVCGCVDKTCTISSQTQYTKQVFDPATNAVTITSKDVESGGYSATMGVTGTAQIVNNAAQFLTKTITHASRDEDGGDTFTQRTVFSHDATTATVDGFQRGAGLGVHDQRVYANHAFTYTGNPAADIDLDKYDIGAGAGNLIDGILDQTQCWLLNGVTTSCAVAPYTYPESTEKDPTPYPGYWDAIQDKTPMAVTDVPAATFNTEESINCAAITPTYTEGTEERPLAIETSSCSGFKEIESHMDCYADIYRDFTVTTTVNGSVLSSESNSSITGVGTTPTIVLTTNFTPSTGTFFGPKVTETGTNSGTIVLQAGDPWGGQILSASEFEDSDWVSAATASNPEAMSLTLHPTLDPSHGTYTLSLSHSLAGINGDSINTTQYFQITP